MLKRKLYWFAVGAAICHASIIGNAVNGRSPAALVAQGMNHFGSSDCAECARPVQIAPPASTAQLPMNQNLLASINGFSQGTTVSAVPNLANIPQVAAVAPPSSAAPEAPLKAPVFDIAASRYPYSLSQVTNRNFMSPVYYPMQAYSGGFQRAFVSPYFSPGFYY